MGLFSRPIADITDIKELFLALTKRRHWKQVGPEILYPIFNNAEGDVRKLQAFIFISDKFHLVDKNFVRLARSEKEPKNALFLIAVTLYRLGSETMPSVFMAADQSDEQNIAIGIADVAFRSSVLCSPFMLMSYAALAQMLSELEETELAIEWCDKYLEARSKLLATSQEQLSVFEQAVKTETDETTLIVNAIKEKCYKRW